MKVFVSAAHTNAQEAKRIASILESRGAEICSTWFQDAVMPYDGDVTSDELRKRGERDLHELMQADFFVQISDVPSPGGSHTELGAALMIDMQGIYLLGPRRHVFHHLTCITQCQTVEELCENLFSDNDSLD